jgi:hypothetical protein
MATSPDDVLGRTVTLTRSRCPQHYGNYHYVEKDGGKARLVCRFDVDSVMGALVAPPVRLSEPIATGARMSHEVLAHFYQMETKRLLQSSTYGRG